MSWNLLGRLQLASFLFRLLQGIRLLMTFGKLNETVLQILFTGDRKLLFLYGRHSPTDLEISIKYYYMSRQATSSIVNEKVSLPLNVSRRSRR